VAVATVYRPPVRMRAKASNTTAASG
jgi:hypothetical protein